MNNQRQQFLIEKAVGILQKDHRGREQCIKRRDMSMLLFFSDSDNAIHETRHIMSQAANHYPVTFTPKSRGGYYYIESVEELMSTMRTMENYAKKFLMRRNVLSKAYYKKTGKQISFLPEVSVTPSGTN